MSGQPRGSSGGDGDVSVLPIIGGLVVGSGILACLLVSKNPEVLPGFSSLIQDLLGTGPSGPSQQKKKNSSCHININKRKWLTEEQESQRKAKLQIEQLRKEQERKEQKLKEQKVKEQQLLKEEKIKEVEQRELNRHLNQQLKAKLRKEQRLLEEQLQKENVRLIQHKRRECTIQEQQQQVERLKERLQQEQLLLEQMQRESDAELQYCCSQEW